MRHPIPKCRDKRDKLMAPITVPSLRLRPVTARDQSRLTRGSAGS